MNNSETTVNPVSCDDVASRPALLSRFTMPAGNYDTWSKEQAYEAELVAKLFANSYLIDFNLAATATRLGAQPEGAAAIGNKIFNHWLTQHYVQQFQTRFENMGKATRDTVLALLWRDASNFQKGANAIARVSAQKCLAQAMGLTETQAKRTATELMGNVRGGVIMVKMCSSPEDWEKQAGTTQEAMLKQLDESD
jgi:hypothetical protein